MQAQMLVLVPEGAAAGAGPAVAQQQLAVHLRGGDLVGRARVGDRVLAAGSRRLAS